jgi:hypothetical protein
MTFDIKHRHRNGQSRWSVVSGDGEWSKTFYSRADAEAFRRDGATEAYKKAKRDSDAWSNPGTLEAGAGLLFVGTVVAVAATGLILGAAYLATKAGA